MISASAGTGKTYQLSLRFIALLALGYPVEKLIALTFTRNAAAEFRQRILTDLADGAETEEKAQKLASNIRSMLSGAGDAVPLSPAAVDSVTLARDDFMELLQKVIRSLSKLNLSTMDSFFSKLVNTHSMELGHPAIEQMDDAENELVRSKALMSLLLNCSEEDEDALVELCYDLQGDAKKESFAVLEQNVKDYHTLYQNTEEQADEVWGNAASFGVFDPGVLQTLKELLRGASPEEAQERLAAFLKMCAPKLKGLVDANRKALNSYVAKGLDNLIENLAKKKDAPPKTLAWLYGAAEDERTGVGELQVLARRVREVHYLLPAVLKSLSIMNLMRRYDKIYRKDVQAAGKYVFADMPRKVAALLDTRNPANIAYRLDGRLDHWMLDEFQDTSPAQWKALYPLLDEIRSTVSEDTATKQAMRSLFVVGDEKQSIYGWREATPRLFRNLSEASEWQAALQVSSLNRSWRSADAIMGVARDVERVSPEGEPGVVRMGFVNDLFAGIFADNPAKRAQFTQHCVAEKNLSMRGCVCIRTLSKEFIVADAAGLEVTPPLERMCREMRDTLHEVGFGRKNKMTAAILVRSNDDVMFVYQWFKRECKDLPVMAFADEDVGCASFLGELFLHFFRWMQHPGDSFREGMLLASPLPLLRGESDAAAAWRRWRALLDEQGYVAALMALTADVPGARDDRAFREWINAARQCDITGCALDEWIRTMEHMVTKSNPPKSYLHIMTYHKSKGAQYDVVLLPFNKVKPPYDIGRVKIYKCMGKSGRELGAVQGVIAKPKVERNDSAYGASPFKRLADSWKNEAREEAINVLYVAVTRAKYANYIYLNGDALNESYSALILNAVGDRRTWGEPDWHLAFAEKDASGGEAVAQPHLAEPKRRRRKVSPSKLGDTLAERGQTPAHGTAEDGQADAAAFGTAVHALFEQVEWLGQGADPAWMTAPQSAEEQLVAAALQQADIRALFTRRDGQVAYNEQPVDAISTLGSEEVWVSGTLDRLVLTHDAVGEVAAAHVIDFKTDIRRGETPEEQDDCLRETHAAQMQAYQSLIMQAFALPAEAVSVTLISCPRDGAPARAVPWSARA